MTDAVGEEIAEVGASALTWHIAAYASVNAAIFVLFVINKGRMAFRDINGIFDYWPIYVHVGWGALLLAHIMRARRAR